MEDTKKVKFRKTVKLNAEQKKALREWMKGFGTNEEAAEAAALDAGTFARIKELGRGNSVNVGKLMSVVMPVTVSA